MIDHQFVTIWTL